MSARTPSIQYTEHAENYLLGHWGDLTPAQQARAREFFADFHADPWSMAREPALPLNGPWYAERPIGEGRVANVHFKTETAQAKTTVVVLAVSFAYVM